MAVAGPWAQMQRLCWAVWEGTSGSWGGRAAGSSHGGMRARGQSLLGRICPRRGEHIGHAPSCGVCPSARHLPPTSAQPGDPTEAAFVCSQRNEGDLFHRLWHIMNEVLDLRRQVLVGHLTHDRMKDVKRHITARLDWGNE